MFAWGLAPAAGFLAGAAGASLLLPAASASACRSGRCDTLRMKLTGVAGASLPAAPAFACRSGRCDPRHMKLTGAERRPWLLPLSDPT